MRNLIEIVVPSGNARQDAERAKAAESINTDNVPYILSGVGPDLNEARFDGKGYMVDSIGYPVWFEDKPYVVDGKTLDVHSGLWNYFVEKHLKDEIKFFGVDTASRTSRQNLMNSFPVGQEGTYIVRSYPLHDLKFMVQEWKLKRRGLMSKDVKIKYVPTKTWGEQTAEEWLHGTISLVKALVS